MGRSEKEQVLNRPFPSQLLLEPPAEWARLRRERPVVRVKLPSGGGASLLARCEDVKSVLSAPRSTPSLRAPGAARISANKSGGVFGRSTAEDIPRNGEGHQRWRRMVGKLLGVPDSDRDKFAYWSDTFLNLTRCSDEEIDAAQTAFVDYTSAHVTAKKADPGDDLISELITGIDSEGERVSDAALVATGKGLLVAGQETTANMIGEVVTTLLADRSLVRSAVEVSRFDTSPGFGLPQFIKESTEVAGTVFPAGTTLVCNMAAAHRDDGVCEGADEMNLSRIANTRPGFGSGAHSCPARALARTELQPVLAVLLRRLPDLELAVGVGELRRVEGLAVGGLREVPVRW